MQFSCLLVKIDGDILLSLEIKTNFNHASEPYKVRLNKSDAFTWFKNKKIKLFK